MTEAPYIGEQPTQLEQPGVPRSGTAGDGQKGSCHKF